MDPSRSAAVSLEALGPSWQVFFITLYSLTAVLAFLVNLLTIAVLLYGRRVSSDLRLYLINLAIADLLLATTTIPFTYTNYIIGRWIFWSWLCPIASVAQLTAITVSIWLLVAIAISRYLAILRPLKQCTSAFRRHCSIIIHIIWFGGLTIGITQAWVTRTVHFTHQGVTFASCDERWPPESAEGQLYTLFIFTVTFGLPIIVLVVVNGALARRVWHYETPEMLQMVRLTTRTTMTPQQQHQQRLQLARSYCRYPKGEFIKRKDVRNRMADKRYKVLRMLIAVIAVFALSWAPIQLFTLFIYFSPTFFVVNSSTQYYTVVLVYFACHWISCAHSFMNAILYSLMSVSFRADTCRLLRHCLWRHS